jgi:hypothetical protein
MNVAPTSLLSPGHQRLLALVMSLQFQPAGDDAWQDMADGVYRRVSPDQINISQKGV